MEKFYRAEPDSALYNDYLLWMECRDKAIGVAQDLLHEFGVQATRYSFGREYFSIDATASDLKKFDGQFKKHKSDCGFCVFKKATPLGKEWKRRVAQIPVMHKPFVPDYFRNALGKMRTRLFDIDGTVYCSIECDKNFVPNDKLTEMKASEFFRIIEAQEEAETGKGDGT